MHHFAGCTLHWYGVTGLDDDDDGDGDAGCDGDDDDDYDGYHYVDDDGDIDYYDNDDDDEQGTDGARDRRTGGGNGSMVTVVLLAVWPLHHLHCIPPSFDRLPQCV